MNNILNLARNQLKDRESCLEWLKDIELIPTELKDIELIDYERAIRETSIDDIKSGATVCDWYSNCREICTIALDTRYEEEGKIGGQGHVVEIDESKVGKRKYNRGRWREGILGMIDRDTGDYRLGICPDNKRDVETFIPLIEKHVEKGTQIIIDCHKAYNNLNEKGYQHQTVNHSKYYKDPITGAHTNTIEGSWKHLKHHLTKTGLNRDDIADHMCEFLWRRDCRLKELDPFDQILKDIKIVN